jgi:hypothetical protein
MWWWFAAAMADPVQLQWSGRVLDPSGRPTTGAVDVSVGLFAAANGGDPLWSESLQDVAAVDGFVSVVLGFGSAIPSDLFDDGDLFLAVTVDGRSHGGRLPVLAVPAARRIERVQAAGSPPVACGAATEGRWYLDLTAGALRVCDGVQWKDLG